MVSVGMFILGGKDANEGSVYTTKIVGCTEGILLCTTSVFLCVSVVVVSHIPITTETQRHRDHTEVAQRNPS